MSAWLVSQAHIDVLVQGLAESEIVTDVDPDEIGRILWRENLLSIKTRYPSARSGNYPGDRNFRVKHIAAYVYRRPTVSQSKGTLYTSARCFRYQSCENKDWETSQAGVWIGMLIASLETAGYNFEDNREGPWGQEEADVHLPTVSVLA